MLNQEALALIGVAVVGLDWLVTPWTAPGANLERDFAVVVSPDGDLAGYLMLESDPPYTLVYSTGAVAIGYHGCGLGGAMLDEIERRASALATQAPAGEPVVWHMGVLADEPLVAGLLRERGLDEVRRAWSMTITFDRPLAPPPATISGVEIRPLAPGGEIAVYRCLADAFQDHWGEQFRSEEQWLHRHVTGAQRFDPTLWWVAWQNGHAVGALVADAEAEEDPALAYVGALGVRRPARRRGVGEALLRTSFQAFARRGKRGAQLHVDSQSLTGATRLYERVGMTAQPRFATWQKQLRP
jgi:mycothiol synthase